MELNYFAKKRNLINDPLLHGSTKKRKTILTHISTVAAKDAQEVSAIRTLQTADIKETRAQIANSFINLQDIADGPIILILLRMAAGKIW